MSDAVREWIERSPYGASLGVEVSAMGESEVRLRLPYKDENSNPGKALHGGVAASMIAIAGQALGRDALGAESGPWHTTAVQVGYLSAAIGEPIHAVATLLRKGKEICFSNVRVETDAGKPIAQGLTIVRGRFDAEETERPKSAGDAGTSDPGPMGPFIGRVPFIGKLGLVVEHMTGGTSRIVMPWNDGNADLSGGVHEGALLALLDTTGAMASWAVTGPGRFKASTPGVQAQILGTVPKGDLVAYGTNRYRDDEIFFSDVEVAHAETQRIVARGTVIYRIVT